MICTFDMTTVNFIDSDNDNHIFCARSKIKYLKYKKMIGGLNEQINNRPMRYMYRYLLIKTIRTKLMIFFYSEYVKHITVKILL